MSCRSLLKFQPSLCPTLIRTQIGQTSNYCCWMIDESRTMHSFDRFARSVSVVSVGCWSRRPWSVPLFCGSSCQAASLRQSLGLLHFLLAACGQQFVYDFPRRPLHATPALSASVGYLYDEVSHMKRSPETTERNSSENLPAAIVLSAKRRNISFEILSGRPTRATRV